MEFLMLSAKDFGEPGVFITFEESLEDFAKNFIYLGFNLYHMVFHSLIGIDHVYIERIEIDETGEYNL